MKNLKLVLTTAVLASLVGCVNGDDYGTPDLSNECVTIATTKNVTDVTGIATATATQYTTLNDVTDYIEAYVTSSDEGGNFYKSISMVSIDGLTGFSMPVDNYNLFNEFEPGRKVTIKLDKNRFFNKQHGSTVIGSSYENGVGRISGVEYKDVILRSCDKIDEEDLVNRLTIAQAKNDQNLNKIIEFDAVQFTDASVGRTYFDSSLNPFPTWTATNHYITDADGNTIILRASEFAKFASDIIPGNNGKIRGVLTKYNSEYQFMIRTLNDVMLTDDRIVPLFEETFSTNWNNWTKFSVTGAQVWVLDTQFGNPGNCAKMSGFASSVNNANEDWLISPSIDLSSVSNATLKFDNASRFPGNLIEAKISTNYVSGNPNTATWTNLTATLDTNTGAYVWTNSGNIDISSYTGGTVHIAFKYTSTTSASSTWEIDNVKIQ